MNGSYKFKEKYTPQFMPGDTVWAVQGPKPKPEETKVNGVECVLFEELLCVGYRLPLFYFVGEDGLGEYWPIYKVFGSQEEAERICQWTEVDDITDEEWQQAIGDREDESHYDSELGPCCANISAIRDLLYQCWKHKGLPLRDIEHIKINLLSGHQETLEDPSPILKKIWESLHLEQVEVSLEEDED